MSTMSYSKRTAFCHALRLFSTASNLYDAAQEWEVIYDNEDDINHDTWTSCEFCGTPIQHFLHICNKLNEHTKMIGKQCYENICFLTYGLEPPQRSGGGSRFLTGQIKQLYKDIPFDFVSWKNWFVRREDKLPYQLKPGVDALKRFDILPKRDLDMFIEHYDNHRLFPLKVLLPALLTPRHWLPEYLTISQARRYRNNHSIIMASLRASRKSEQAKTYYRLLCRAFAWAPDLSIEDFHIRCWGNMHKNEASTKLIWFISVGGYSLPDEPPSRGSWPVPPSNVNEAMDLMQNLLQIRSQLNEQERQQEKEKGFLSQAEKILAEWIGKFRKTCKK
jgi:hypothetical protein